MKSWVSPQAFDYSTIIKTAAVKRPRGNNGGKTKRTYKDIWCAFDIETSTIDVDVDGDTQKQAFMYLFGFQIGENAPTIVGRDWSDFLLVLSSICTELKEDETLVVYVHNLSFEFQFLAGIIDFDKDSVFSTGNRTILRATTMCGKIEFRCSRLQTNQKLASFLRDMGVPVQKETLDYDEVRYPWTDIPDEVISYQIADVLGLVQAMKKQATMDGDTMYTIPLTKTGYCRRAVKQAIASALDKHGKPFLRHFVIEPLMPDESLYLILRAAFRGGDVHASRYYTGAIAYNVSSVDRSSSYPDVMINEKYPVSPFQHLLPSDCTLSVIDRLMRKGRALVFTVYVQGLKLRNEFNPNPYISLDKCVGYRTRDDYEIDNGRILWIRSCQMSITDIDWRIIAQEYTWDDIRIVDCYVSHYGYLPEEIREVVREYYRRKTTLKPQPGDTEEMKIQYRESKALLNSFYGMSAQDPGKRRELWDDEIKDFKDDTTPLSDILAKSAKSAVMPYQWGVWTTAWARYALYKGYKCISPSQWIYSDTDSLKYCGKADFEKLNNKLKERSEANGAFADDRKGKRHYMGVFENETPVPYSRFATLGAKKYVCEDADGIHITIAGIPKKLGAVELQEKGGIERFCDCADDGGELLFDRCGKKCVIYNDKPETTGVEIEGHWLPITRNAVIVPTTYVLSMSDEYNSLLSSIAEELGVDADAWSDN